MLRKNGAEQPWHARQGRRCYRARIREQFVTLCGDREAITAQLEALDKDSARHGTDPALLDELPELAGRLDELPERLQADLFAAFDIQILWNPPMKQATFFATISDTTPGIITALLDRANDDPATASTASRPHEATTERRRPVFGFST